LKRLVSDKRIQGNPSFFLGKIWPDDGLALLDLAEFGVDLESQAGRLSGAGRANRRGRESPFLRLRPGAPIY
jgi:hypothetical protein